MYSFQLKPGKESLGSKPAQKQETTAEEVIRLLFDGVRLFDPATKIEYSCEEEPIPSELLDKLERVKILEIHYQGPDALFLEVGGNSITQKLRTVLPPDRSIDDYLLTIREDRWAGLLLKGVALPRFKAAARFHWEACVFVMFPGGADEAKRLEIGEAQWLLVQKNHKILRLLPLPENVEHLARPPAATQVHNHQHNPYPAPLFVWREPGWKQRQEAAKNRKFLKRYALFCLSLLFVLGLGLRGGIAWYQKKWIDSSLEQQQIGVRDRKYKEQKKQLETTITKIQNISAQRAITRRNHAVVFRQIIATTPPEFVALESISGEVEHICQWQIKGFALESTLIPTFQQELEKLFPTHTISLENMVRMDGDEAQQENGMRFRFTLKMVSL